jgi:hypothetical protein
VAASHRHRHRQAVRQQCLQWHSCRLRRGLLLSSNGGGNSIIKGTLPIPTGAPLQWLVKVTPIINQRPCLAICSMGRGEQSSPTERRDTVPASDCV